MAGPICHLPGPQIQNDYSDAYIYLNTTQQPFLEL